MAIVKFKGWQNWNNEWNFNCESTDNLHEVKGHFLSRWSLATSVKCLNWIPLANQGWNLSLTRGKSEPGYGNYRNRTYLRKRTIGRQKLMLFSNLLVLFPFLIFLPCCFLGRVDVIDELTMPPPQKGTEEQKEIETIVIEKATKAPKQFQIEEIGRLGQKGTEAQNIFTNASQMPLCQCPSRKRMLSVSLM